MGCSGADEKRFDSLYLGITFAILLCRCSCSIKNGLTKAKMISLKTASNAVKEISHFCY